MGFEVECEDGFDPEFGQTCLKTGGSCVYVRGKCISSMFRHWALERYQSMQVTVFGSRDWEADYSPLLEAVTLVYFTRVS